jgi:hypothetical protein
MMRAFGIDQAVGRWNYNLQKIASRKAAKEITMRSHGYTTVLGTHINVGRASDARGWCQQLQDWWTTYKAARKQAKLIAFAACWDAKRETIRPLRTEAAPEMAATPHVLSVVTML